MHVGVPGMLMDLATVFPLAPLAERGSNALRHGPHPAMGTHS
jgi:hypothetical protein